MIHASVSSGRTAHLRVEARTSLGRPSKSTAARVRDAVARLPGFSVASLFQTPDDLVDPPQPLTRPAVIVVSMVGATNLKLDFADGLRVDVQAEDGAWFATHDHLKLLAYGDTLAGLMEAIRDDLLFAWEQYAESPDEDLSPDALAVKRWLLTHAKRS